MENGCCYSLIDSGFVSLFCHLGEEFVLDKKKRQTNYWLGILAELWVCVYLFFKGYRILQRNFRCTFGEIDIIATKNSIIVFVEVKKRKTIDQAKFALKKSQQERIKRAAKYYLRKVHAKGKNKYISLDLRFDLVAVDYWFCIERVESYIYD